MRFHKPERGRVAGGLVIVLLALGIAALGLTRWYVSSEIDGSLPDGHHVGGVAPEAARSALSEAELSTVPSTWNWAEETPRNYLVRQSSALVVRSPDGTVRGETGVSLLAEMECVVVSANAKQVRLSVRLNKPVVDIPGMSDPAAALAGRFNVVLSPQGRLLDVSLPDALDENDGLATLVESMFAGLQVILPGAEVADAGADGWTQKEEDVSGAYDAVYEVTGPGRIHKRKSSYGRRFGDLALLRELEVVSSRCDVVWARDSFWIEELELAETTVARSAQGISFESVFELQLLALDVATPEQRVRIQEGVLQGEVAPLVSRKTVGGRAVATADVARDRCGELLDSIVDGTGDLVALRELANLLAQRGDLCEAVIERIDRGDVTGGTLSRLFHALEVAGTPEAQATLAEVVETSARSKEQRVYAVVALGGVVAPTADAIDSLIALSGTRLGSSELRSAVTLGLGRLARESRALGTPDHIRATARLVALLNSAPDELQSAQALKAMGNVRAPGLVDVLSPWLTAEDRMTRLAAAQALARTPREDVPGILASHLQVEQEPQVRIQLVKGLESQESLSPRELSIVEGALNREPIPRVRQAMVELLGRHLDLYPDAWVTMNALLEHESDADVRRELIRALANDI